MSTFYTNIQEQIEPYKEIVFYCGLTELEVRYIEKKIDKSFPVYFREFLKTFGVRQDLVFGLFSRENDLIEQNSHLSDKVRGSYSVIGDNGGEEFWLINTDNPDDTTIYGLQDGLNGQVVKLEFGFETLLFKGVSKLIDEEAEKQNNDSKNWCVQFAIPADNVQSICETIPLLLMQDWELKEISPALVRCYETTAKLADGIIKFTRQEFEGWSSPIYYFDLKEPVCNIGKQSLIKDLDQKLKARFLAYKLIDYGVRTLPHT